MKGFAAFLIFCSPALGGYSYARTITVDHTKIGSADLANFTVSVNGTYTYLANAANRGKILQTTPCGIDMGVCPADLVFTSDGGCLQRLSWEIQRYDPVTGQIVAWVMVPSISHSVDTVIYECYGNIAVNTFQGGAVCSAWDGSTRTIYHLESVPINDSGCGAVHLSSSGNPSAVPGAVGSAVSFPSTWQYAGAEAHNFSAVSGAGDGSITLSAWAKFAAFNAQDVDPVSFAGLANVNYPGNPVLFALNGQNQALFKMGDNSGYNHQSGVTPSPLNADMWYFLAGTWDGSRLNFYLNGVQISSTAQSFSRTDRYVALNFIETGRYSQLALDEMKIAGTARTADWILAEYNNQSSPSTFYAVGSEVTLANPGQARRSGEQAFVE